MEFSITKKIRDFEKKIRSQFIKNLDIKSNIEKDDIDYLKRITEDAILDFSKLGYIEIEERYIDILNVDTFHFCGWLEIDDYANQIEFNIEKVYPNLSLLNFDEKILVRRPI